MCIQNIPPNQDKITEIISVSNKDKSQIPLFQGVKIKVFAENLYPIKVFLPRQPVITPGSCMDAFQYAGEGGGAAGRGITHGTPSKPPNQEECRRRGRGSGEQKQHG